MNRPRFWIRAGLVLCAIAAALSFGLQRKTAAAQAEAVALARRRALVVAEAGQLRQRARLLGAQAEAAKASVDRGTAALAAPAAPGAAGARDGGPSTYGTTQIAAWQAKRHAALRADPQLQLLYVKRSRSFFVQEFGPFFAAAQLPPETVERFLAAAGRYDEQMMDLGATAADLGDPSRAAVADLKKRATSEREQAFRDLLGEDGFRAFREYDRMSAVRGMVARVAGEAAVQGVPLTPAQANAAIETIAKATASYRAGGNADLRTIDWSTADAPLRQILDPAQATILFCGERDDQRLLAAVQRALAAEKAAPPRAGS